MEDIFFSFDQIPQLSKRDIATQLGDEDLMKFHKYKIELEQFGQVIEDKKRDNINRELLVRILEKQSKHYELSTQSARNIELLKTDSSFAITTAHQPSFLTGPLYFIYKIFSAINLAEKLKEKYPAYEFIPVYVIGAEDHDFEEVNHMHLFGKTIKWESEQTGAVGRMRISKMKESLSELFEIIGDNDNARTLKSIIENAYNHHNDYASFTISIVNQLFTQHGLVCLSMDDSELKKEMSTIFKEELLTQSAHELVSNDQKRIEELGFKSQVHARAINLFYLDDTHRRRIVFEDNRYKILNSEISFSEHEILMELNENPDRFSPNVILRPLYQEKILPNLAYVGGGGELAYWMELKSVFEKHQINFPMLVRRDSVLLIDNSIRKLLDKIKLPLEDVFMNKNEIVDRMFLNDANYKMKDEKLMLQDLFERISEKATGIDKGLLGMIASAMVKSEKSIELIENKLKKSIKSKEEQSIRQLDKLINKIHPNNGLQERYDNFIPYYLNYGTSFMETLKNKLDSLDQSFKVIVLP